MKTDTEGLRDMLIDYYGTAMTNGNPMAVIELSNVERASEEELINTARSIGWSVEEEY